MLYEYFGLFFSLKISYDGMHYTNVVGERGKVWVVCLLWVMDCYSDGHYGLLMDDCSV